MKKIDIKLHEVEISYLRLFGVTAIFCIIFILFQQSELLLHSQILDKSTLSLVRYQESNSKALFLYVLKERIWLIPLLYLLSTTYLAGITGYGMVLWYGTCAGAVTGVAMIRYGLSGLVLVLGAAVPQYFLYVPAVIVAIGLTRKRRVADNKFFVQLFLLEVVVIIGCVLESYVNPQLIEKIIYLFI